jgi:hypothetical protein
MGMIISPKGKKMRNDKGSFAEVLGAFGILTFVAIVMRLELLALLVPLALESMARGSARLYDLLVVGVIVGGASQGASFLDERDANREGADRGLGRLQH